MIAKIARLFGPETPISENRSLDERALDQIFREARTANGFIDRPVSDADLAAIYELAKYGPTSANASPLRMVAVRSAEGKARLEGALSPGNVEKTRSAPVTLVFGYDLDFYERLPELFPHADARSWFLGKPDFIAATARRNAALQAAYVMLAARALGFDVGPMSGFDHAVVDAAFFGGTSVQSDFLCNLGYGDDAKLFPRSPRLPLGDVLTFA